MFFENLPQFFFYPSTEIEVHLMYQVFEALLPTLTKKYSKKDSDASRP